MRHQLINDYYESNDYLTKLREKIANLKEMEADPYLRAKKIMDVYSVDPIRFIEDFLMLKLTEFGGEPKPFFLFQYQRRIILRLQEAEMSNQDIDLLVDKPRGMGLTWLISAYFLLKFLYIVTYLLFLNFIIFSCLYFTSKCFFT